jgi:TrmH family RNA methyltransferase
VRRLAAQARLRRAEGRFVIEGPLLVAEAVDAGLALEAVFVEARVGPVATGGAELVTVADGALDRVGDVGTSQGVLALASTPAPPDELASDGTVLVVHEVGDPGNLGTLLRSAEAAGAAAVVVAGGVDVWSPKVVRAAAGSSFRLPVLSVLPVLPATASDALLGRLRDAGLVCLAAVARGGQPHDRVDLGGAVAIVVGSEAHGLPAALVAQCDGAVTIELAGPAESLNVAMAGTVLLFEALRQRRAAASTPGPAGSKDWTSMAGQARVSSR